MEKYRLREHQEYALAMLEVNDGLMVSYEAGTGKTAIALTYIYKHIKRGDAKDALVICPASLVPSWEQAIEDMVMFEGFDEGAVKLLKERVTIRSFQKTYRSKRVQVGKNGDRTTYRRVVELRDDVDKYWSILVVDEAHQCAAHDSIQTKVAIMLAKLSKKVISLSGTYLHGGKGRPAYYKAYGEVQVVTKGQAFKNWSEFKTKAVTAYDRWFKPLEYDEPYCKRLMEDHSITCRLEDCVDMPPKVEQEVRCPLVEKAIYTDLKSGDIAKYNLDIQNAGGQYTKMLQVCSGSMKINDTSTMKLRTSKDDALGDILNGTERPVVIFCNYRASVDRAAVVAKKAGRRVVTFDGRSKSDTWKDFQSGNADCIVCQYQSGGVGLNLQIASIEVLYEPCYSALLLTQAKGRIFRTGQKNKCIYYYLYTPNTIEKKVWDTVRAGMDVTDKLLEEWSFKGVI